MVLSVFELADFGQLLTLTANKSKEIHLHLRLFKSVGHCLLPLQFG